MSEASSRQTSSSFSYYAIPAKFSKANAFLLYLRGLPGDLSSSCSKYCYLC